jgi:hypothetical protein
MKIKKIAEFAFRSLIFIGLLLMIIFFLFWLPILEWYCKFKAWC